MARPGAVLTRERARAQLPPGVGMSALQRLREIEAAAAARERLRDNPYRTSFVAFLGLLHTVDEARGGEVRAWPVSGGWASYWSIWEDALLRRRLLLVDKTRRTMASNLMSAFDLWVASGGVDPRWPALTRSSSNRLVLIQARKLEKKAGSADFVHRIQTMYEQAERTGLRAAWPDFPVWTWQFGHGSNTVGGEIEALPEGADQSRGPGATLVHMEEVGFWDQAAATISATIPALTAGGSAGEDLSGHLVAVTTPNAMQSFLGDIRDGRV